MDLHVFGGRPGGYYFSRGEGVKMKGGRKEEGDGSGEIFGLSNIHGLGLIDICPVPVPYPTVQSQYTAVQ